MTTKVIGFNELLLVVLGDVKYNPLKPLSGYSASSPETVEKRRRLKESDRLEIIELYASGLSTRSVAAQTRLAKTTVLNVLKRAGVPLRPRGAAR